MLLLLLLRKVNIFYIFLRCRFVRYCVSSGFLYDRCIYFGVSWPWWLLWIWKSDLNIFSSSPILLQFS